MEYVDGMTLREYLNERGGKLTSRETVHFFSQILKALEHAHANVWCTGTSSLRTSCCWTMASCV